MGGVNKPELEVDGRRLLDAALAAATGAVRMVVVGDVPVPDGVLRTREEPPFAGPVAGLEPGWALLDSAAGDDRAQWTLVLASDLPKAQAAMAVLLAADPGNHDGTCLLNEEGGLRWLLGCYGRSVLTGRLADRMGITAAHRLLEPLDLVGVMGAASSTIDLETPEDVAAWRRRSP